MPTRANKLFLTKLVHTIIFISMSLALVYIFYGGITRTYNWVLFSAIGAILVEGAVLIFNRFQCPLANLARKYGDKKGSVTDMFYPKWFVPHVFRVSTVLFVIGLVLLGFRYFAS